MELALFSKRKSVQKFYFKMSDSDAKEDENVILHVAVLGFHHKKGTVLEYSYPPLSEGLN